MAQRQRLDRRQVQVGHLLHVPLLVLDAAHVDLVGAVGEVERRERAAAPSSSRRASTTDAATRRGAGADEVARRAPEEVLVPDAARSAAASTARSPSRRAPVLSRK